MLARLHMEVGGTGERVNLTEVFETHHLCAGYSALEKWQVGTIPSSACPSMDGGVRCTVALGHWPLWQCHWEQGQART